MNRRIIIASACLLVLGLLFIFIGFTTNKPEAQKPQEILPTQSPLPQENASVTVKRVVDGDTIELSTGEKVRYIGIDTPETVDPRRPVACFGKEASEENKKLVEGKPVILEKDISETDKFNRLLRYVYIKLDNGNLLFVNDYLVRNGFAKASTYPPDIKFSSRFTEAEKEARENQRGLWNMCQ